MALTVTDRGTGGNASPTTTPTAVPGSNCTAGALVVLTIAYDNTGSGGADGYQSIADSAGNTWTPRMNGLYDPGIGGEGIVLRQFTTGQDVGTVTTSVTVTVTLSAVARYAFTFCEVTASVGVPVFETGAAGTGSNTATPTVTTGTIPKAHAVIGCGAAESIDTWLEDGDTTDGTWSTKQSTGVSSAGNAVSVISQAKVVTAAATQTYDPTLLIADVILGWIDVEESITVTPTTAAIAIATFAPVIGYAVIPTTSAIAITTFAPSILPGTIVVPTPGLVGIVSYEPDVDIGGLPGAGSAVSLGRSSGILGFIGGIQ